MRRKAMMAVAVAGMVVGLMPGVARAQYTGQLVTPPPTPPPGTRGLYPPMQRVAGEVTAVSGQHADGEDGGWGVDCRW